MGKKYFFLFFWISSICSFGQNLNLDVNGAGIGANGVIRFDDPSMMGKKAGVKVDYSDIRGNCFFYAEWNPAIVTLRNKAIVRFSKLKLNLYSNDIHYLDKSGQELVADSKIVGEIFLFDDKDTTKIISTLTKKIVGGSESFFQVMNQGNFALLKRVEVSLFKGEYDAMRAKNDFRFLKKISYFLKKDSNIKLLKELNQESFDEQISFTQLDLDWLKRNKNRLKSESQILDFLNYYNSK